MRALGLAVETPFSSWSYTEKVVCRSSPSARPTSIHTIRSPLIHTIDVPIGALEQVGLAFFEFVELVPHRSIRGQELRVLLERTGPSRP